MSLKTGLVSYSSPFTLLDSSLSVVATFTLPSGKHLTVIDISEKSELTVAQKTLKAWKDTAHERLGIMRREAQKKPSEKNKALLKKDTDSVDQYLNIIGLYDQSLNSMIAKSEGNANKIHRIVKDEDRNIQAMSSFAIEEGRVFLNLVITAPWNLKMHAPVLEEHRSLVTKGGGTALIRSGYETAQTLKKDELRLKPMEGSYTYYKDRLMMNEDTTGEFFYPVSQVSIPEPLLRGV